jgi:DNA-binding XRE family transcriptional regulator
MADKMTRYKSIDDLGRAFGVSDVEMELIRQKKKAIEKLKKAREKKGLTQTQLAKLVETKQPAIARMEAGDVGSVSFDFIFKVALVLGTPISLKPPKTAA